MSANRNLILYHVFQVSMVRSDSSSDRTALAQVTKNPPSSPPPGATKPTLPAVTKPPAPPGNTSPPGVTPPPGATNPPGGKPPPPGGAVPSPIDVGNFIVPSVIDSSIDLFVSNKLEYLFVDSKVPHDFAEIMCNRYAGTLATVKDVTTANFLAEALSETSFDLDTLWVGAKNTSNSGWCWSKNNQGKIEYTIPVSAEILKFAVETKNAKVTHERNCGAFARTNHDVPQFMQLDCKNHRGYICERRHGATNCSNSSHVDWIPIADASYKIFSDKVDYETAAKKCFLNDKKSTLAVVHNMSIVTELARYLLIGRPSLENAWIGAKWLNNSYQFEAEPIVLKNESDPGTKYPPWRNNKMTKSGGCVLLDRHLSDIPLFVEARCQRLRPYICSKPNTGYFDVKNYTETIFGDLIVRIYHTPEPWATARDKCKALGASSQLAEPQDAKTLDALIYSMGQNRSIIQHAWIGGEYVDTKWVWASDKKEVPAVHKPLFVQNTTYLPITEVGNTCLNLDRENHISAILYGTNCFYPQKYICTMKKT